MRGSEQEGDRPEERAGGGVALVGWSIARGFDNKNGNEQEEWSDHIGSQSLLRDNLLIVRPAEAINPLRTDKTEHTHGVEEHTVH